ncbi:MAG: sigma-70 family RNA polymerase sigma factor [Chloroflexi bacterium]|nr:sigma-70 family RNA polymerase sigma factor [Chloroflexota bacterium]
MAAGQADPALQSAALAKLCETYWYPLYAYVRRRGYAPEDAQDLTQAFFASFLEKGSFGRADKARGRFRTFLLSSMENYLHGAWGRAVAQKRGGGRPLLSWDAATAEGSYQQEPREDLTPAKIFEKRWAATLLQEVLKKLRAEFSRRGQLKFFDQLKAHLWGEDEAVPYGQLTAELNLSPGALKVTVHRLRRRYREFLRDEIAQTVAEAHEVDDEIRHLMRVLSE